MNVTPVRWDAPLADYEAQVDALVQGFRAADPTAIAVVHHTHPRFLDAKVPWMPRPLSREEIAASPFARSDGQLAVARGYSFLDWEALAEHVRAVGDEASPVHRFEAAVQATIDGRIEELERLLDTDPALVRARSARRTWHDPSVHGATLLHYLVANGVENVNQRTPPNAVEVARLLLSRGADPDATAGLYGGRCGVMAMLVSSSHPAAAGVQVGLVDVLVEFGASVDEVGSGHWQSPLRTALVFGFTETADALVRHGANAEGLDVAAGLGRVDAVRRALPHATELERQRALAYAGQLGRAAVADLLLAAGADPNRLNPAGMHAHATALHHAALYGHLETVETFVKHGARLDIGDTTWHSTPLGWARHGGHAAVVAYLESLGAPRHGVPAAG